MVMMMTMMIKSTIAVKKQGGMLHFKCGYCMSHVIIIIIIFSEDMRQQ